jgi:two-component system nitrogen regulation response regulator NtrX
MKGNLLIVDDEVMLLKTLKLNLLEYADDIFTAENGREALEKIEKELIHCIICDINMPKMNGVDVIKALRDKGINTPFIFYTGHGNHELMLEAAKHGAFDFLNKPNLDGLEEVVQRGLKAGVTKEADQELDPSEFMSEYAMLLKEIEAK